MSFLPGRPACLPPSPRSVSWTVKPACWSTAESRLKSWLSRARSWRPATCCSPIGCRPGPSWIGSPPTVKHPRATILQRLAKQLFARLDRHGRSSLYELAEEVDQVGEELLRDKGVHANVDFYSGVLSKAMGLDHDSFPCVFAMARVSAGSLTGSRITSASGRTRSTKAGAAARMCRSTVVLRIRRTRRGPNGEGRPRQVRQG